MSQSNGQQKVPNGRPARARKQALPAATRLNRTAFRTDRSMDFFNQKELVTQTGHAADEWPFVVVKELVDNALDECETAGIAPVVEVTADAAGITVCDNGPGLPEATLRGVLDFSVHVSDKEAYVSPCRGAQGNALKTLVPMPWVCDPEGGRYVVEACGKRHVIVCGCDPISQRPVVRDDVTATRTKKGTRVRLQWTPREGDEGPVWPFDGLQPLLDERGEWDTEVGGFAPCFAERFRALIEGYTMFNRHLSLTLNWFGEKRTWKATDRRWCKWKPSDPTSAHWYEVRHLGRLIGAYVTHDREAGTDRLVSDFVAEFDGLSRSGHRTRVLDQAGLKRARLSQLVADDRFDTDRIAALLRAMQAHSRPVKSERLGVVGEDHFRRRLLDMGVLEESFRYTRKLGKVNPRPAEGEEAMPWVLECAFGWLGSESEDRRRIYTGANWSSAINNPFRSFGATGEGLESVLADQYARRNEPVVFALLLSHPRVEYTDRGKSALVVGQ